VATRQREYQGQSSRRGISDVFVYLILLLIALFSGFIVRFMAGTVIEQYVNSTIGLRLLLHGLTLTYNSVYSLPSGLTSFSTTVPEQCSLQCVDCNYSVVYFPFFARIVSCDCDDGLAAVNQILDVPPDERRLVCDDYVVNDINTVMLFYGRKPLSAAVKLNLQLYPKSSLIFDFMDLLKGEISSDAFSRDFVVFSEVPVNLNDYATVRRLLTDSSYIDYAELLTWDGNDTITASRASYDNYDSIVGSVGFVQGLQGLVETVFTYSRNQTIPAGKEDLYWKRTSDNSHGVLLAPASPIDLLIQPGVKINLTGKPLCEYACYNQNSLEDVCPGDAWHEVACFDFSTIESAVCDNCSANEFTYDINLDCPDGECVGGLAIDYSKFTYMDIFTGTDKELDSYNITFSDFGTTRVVLALANEKLAYESSNYDCTELTCHQCIYTYVSNGSPISTNLQEGACDNVGEPGEQLVDNLVPCVKCFTKQSVEQKTWPLSDDCALSVNCNDDGFTLNVATQTTDLFGECSTNNLFVNGLCEIANAVVIEARTGCDSEGSYHFNYDDVSQILTLSDLPSTTQLLAILSAYGISDSYQVTPFGTCGDPDFAVQLDSIGSGAIHSKTVSVTDDGLNDRAFQLSINASPLNVLTITLGVVG